MSNHYLLDPLNLKSFIGFDRFFEELENASKLAKLPSYPPYNIKQIDENRYVIEIAVAGFSKSEVEIQLEGNKLIVKGKSNSVDESEYIYKGISNREFIRAFTLADKIEVKDAEMENGLLKIWLSNLVKVQDAVKKIAIKS